MDSATNMGENTGAAGFNEWIGTGDRLSDLTVSSSDATRGRALGVLDALAGKILVNAETGIEAYINTEQRRKILSGAAVEKTMRNGFSANQHFATASKIDAAWKHAALVKIGGDRVGNKNVAAIKRFVAPILLDDDPAAAYITVKQSVEHGHRIYSLELTEIKKTVGEAGAVCGDEDKRTAPHGQPLAVADDNHLPTVSPESMEKSSNGK
ncbi:MAG: hypothetical protein FWB78_11140 [Treponema sp.]|nr:hypothetical protein [Treponema sp.]